MNRIIVLMMVFPFALFSQSDSSKTPIMIGMECGHLTLDYSLFFKQDKQRYLYQIKGGYSFSGFPTENFVQGKGFNIGGEFDLKFSQKKDYFYYGVGLIFRNYFPYSVYVFFKSEYTSMQQYDYQQWYDVKTNYNISLLNGIGYNVSVSKINVKMLIGAEVVRAFIFKDNIVKTYTIPRNEEIAKSSKNYYWQILPAINISIEYRIF